MDAMKPAGNASTGPNSTENTDEMRREIIFLKNRVQVLEKDLMNTDIELKASNKSLKEKNNDQVVSYNIIYDFTDGCLSSGFFYWFQMKQLTDINSDYSKRLIEMNNLQKEMEKLLLQRSTWNLEFGKNDKVRNVSCECNK